MPSALNEFKHSFQVESLTLYRNEHWTWSLRPAQITLGSGILSLNSECQAFSDAPPGAGEALLEAVVVIEHILKKCFQYQKINYLMLMMVDSHLHYHVIPRYDAVVQFADRAWVDSGWPKFPALADKQHPESEVMTRLQEHIKEQIV